MSSTATSVDDTTPLLQSASEAAYRHVTGEALPKSDLEHAVQKWHNPTINTWRVLATFFSFIVVGANDAIYGVRRDSLLTISKGFAWPALTCPLLCRFWCPTYVKQIHTLSYDMDSSPGPGSRDRRQIT
jgi:hypothetical protein